MAVDRLKLAGDAAAALEKMGIVAYGRRIEGRVTLDGWAVVHGKQLAFSYEVDEDHLTAVELADLIASRVMEASSSDIS